MLAAYSYMMYTYHTKNNKSKHKIDRQKEKKRKKNITLRHKL